MINLSQLNKLIISIIFFTTMIFSVSYSEEEAADIWKDQNKNAEQEKSIEEEVKIESPILSESEENTLTAISELELDKEVEKIIGLFDPEENNFNLSMWIDTDGKDIKDTFSRINKLKLSNFSEDLLFKVLFTNAYPPKENLTSSEFLTLKIDWLIKNRKIQELENLLLTNPEVGKKLKAVKFLINENLSTADIKSACNKIAILDKDIKSEYLDKFKIYCLISNDRKDEAQLIFELLKDKGFKDNFFENKINYLLGYTEKTDQKILDNDLFNFYLCHITSDNFVYEPNEKTNKYIWKYLSSSNLIKINDIEDEETIKTYEKAAAENSFESEEIFNIYKQILFNVNQLINVTESYKTLPGYRARALIYQSILLSDNIEKKLYLTFLLKELFREEKLLNVYSKELTNILRSIDPEKIPENYQELVEDSIKQNYQASRKVKFNNDVLHRSKVIRHFLDNNEKITGKTEKDFKSVYKKIKKNKKYFISIKDIIVLDSLAFDGMKLPQDLNYNDLLSELTVPKNLQELVNQNQLGLTMLKIIEIIGEDNINDLDPETIYFLSKILNELNLKKIRNNILNEALPTRV